MARKADTTDAIEEFESIAERAAAWIGEHLVLVAGVILGLIVGSGGVATYLSQQSRHAEEASNAFDEVHSAYLRAMGADPGQIDVPELANPQAAKAIRDEYVDKYGAIASEYPGAVAGVLARLEQGNLSEASGDLDGSIAIWEETLSGISGNPALEAIIHQRIGQAYEDAAQWAEAAGAHEAASSIDYPLRYWALADAARCYAQAGDLERAKTLAARLEVEAPEVQLPDHVRTLLRELRNQ